MQKNVAANCVRHEKWKKAGISLISLIVTIIVIIILAAIVIFTGLNTPDRANFAKFVSEFSDFRTAVQQDYMQKKAQYAIEGKTRSDAQIYYLIASKADASTITNINEEPTEGSEQYDGTEIKSLEELGVDGLGIKGNYAYQITSDTNVANWKQDKKYYAPDETHWVTDEGDVFILKGYRVEQDGEEKWYLNETVASDTAITGPVSILVSNIKILESSTGTTEAGTNLANNGSVTVYITFEASVSDGSAVTIDQTLPFPVTTNGTYPFTITGGGKTKTIEVPVNNFKEVTIAETVEVGDYVDYVATEGSYRTSGELTGYTPVQTLYTTKKIRTSASGTATMDVAWRVIYKNDTTGEVWISPGIVNTKYDISGDTVLDNSIYLKGIKGYMTGANELQNICKALYSNTTLGVEARCANLTDMNKICNQNPTYGESKYYAYYPQGELPEGATAGTTKMNYTIGGQTFNNVTVRQASSKTHRFYIGNHTYEDGIERVYCANSATTDPDTGYDYYTPSAENPVIVCQTYLNYNYGSTTLNSVINYKTTSGWLASPCVFAYDANANFAMRIANSSNIDGNNLYHSYVRTNASSYGVLPLVSLGSTLQVDKSDTTRDGSTVEKAWHIIKK